MKYAHEFVEHAVIESLNANPGGSDRDIARAAYKKVFAIRRDYQGTPSEEASEMAYNNCLATTAVLDTINLLRKPEA